MYIEVNPRTGDLEMNLPEQYREYSREVEQAVMDEFAFEALNRATLNRMNAFLLGWFQQKGITLPAQTDSPPPGDKEQER